MTFLDTVVLVIAVAFLAVLAVLSSRSGEEPSQDNGLTKDEANAYVDAVNEWNEHLAKMENTRRQMLMNEFALVVWTSIGSQVSNDGVKDRTKAMQVSEDCDMLTITTEFGLVIRASFFWGKRRTRIETEARFLGLVPVSGVGCSMFITKVFEGGYVTIPSKKIFQWMSKVSVELVKSISRIGAGLGTGGDDTVLGDDSDDPESESADGKDSKDDSGGQQKEDSEK